MLIGDTTKKSKSRILKWLDKVLELEPTCKVFYHQKRQYGIFQCLKREEVNQFKAVICERTITWTRILEHTESSGKLFVVEGAGVDRLSICPSYNARPFKG